MKIIRFIDIVESEETEDGLVQEVKYKNFTLPSIIDNYKVEVIAPLFTAEGRLFKNVSIIKYGDEVLKVFGNYKDLNDQKENKRTNFMGFLNGKQTKENVKK